MEDLLIALFQVLFEALAYLPWDLFLYGDVTPGEHSEWGFGFLSLMLGGVVGGVSLLLLPDVVARWPWLRITLLVATPFVSGLLAYGLAELRRSRGWSVRPSAHFWFGWLFTVGLVVVRLTFAHRPGR